MFDRALFKLSGMRATLVLLFASALCQAALIVGQVVTLSLVLANIWNGERVDAQFMLLCGFFACFAMRRLVRFVQAELLDTYALKRSSELRTQLMNVTFSDEASLARRMGTAATTSVTTAGIDEVARYIRSIPPQLCEMSGVSTALLLAMMAIDWVSAVIALATLPVIGLFMFMLGKQAKASAEEKLSESRRLENRFIDMVRGLESIMALGAVERAGNAVFKASERMRKATVKVLSVATLSSALLDLITVLGIAGIAMMLAFRLMDGSMDLATALAALMLAPEIYSPIRSFASSFHASLDGKTALASVLSLLDSTEGDSRDDHERISTIPQWRESSSLDIEGVGFSYGCEHTALSGASFTCRGYRKIGIVGASGSGKSTLIDIVAGFKRPSSGTVSVNGSPVSLLDASWKNQVHYLPQNPTIFHASLEDNMKFYSPYASRDDVLRAIEATGLKRLVNDLPDGLDTVIGDGARSLSGGEAQRVALARVLLDERPVLLFDEPTAHLDLETELELKRRMLACMEGKLVFFATHRLHWVHDMDYVIVLENGHVVETGEPAVLLSQDGALQRLIRSRENGAVA